MRQKSKTKSKSTAVPTAAEGVVMARKAFTDTHPREAAVETAHVQRICRDIGTFREMAKQWGRDGFALVNLAREIGTFINGFLDALPGKQLTIDFWKQFEGMFIDQYGHPITQAQLIWFAKHAIRNPEPITDANIMLSFRKEILCQVDMILEGERIGAGAPEEPNYYNKFFALMDEKRLLPVVSRLESDPHYGPLEQWPEERKRRAWLQFEPFYKRTLEIAAKLQVVNTPQ